MSAKCGACGDTGSLPGSEYLDCTHCDVADDRSKLESWASTAIISCGVSDADLWLIYQYGKAAGRNEQQPKIEGENANT